MLSAMRRRLHAIRDRLRKAYGRPRLRPHRQPVDEPILTVPSQNTNHRNPGGADFRLRQRVPSWEAGRRAAHVDGGGAPGRGVPGVVAGPVRHGRAGMRSAPRQATIAELALVGIAAVWGLTFTMVQDAIAVLPTMAFLAYRFAGATAIVAVVFRRVVPALPRAGWRAGMLMGAFLTAGYIFQTLGLERTSPSDAGFITGLFVVLTPVLGALFLGQRISRSAWAAAAVSAVGL